jgi:hypothetical protein
MIREMERAINTLNDQSDEIVEMDKCENEINLLHREFTFQIWNGLCRDT